MSEKPDFIDNIDGNTLSKALKYLLNGDDNHSNSSRVDL